MSGRVYSLTHTAAANMHTHTSTCTEEEMAAGECTETSSETNGRSLCRTQGQNANNSEMNVHKGNKHSCFAQICAHT